MKVFGVLAGMIVCAVIWAPAVLAQDKPAAAAVPPAAPQAQNAIQEIKAKTQELKAATEESPTPQAQQSAAPAQQAQPETQLPQELQQVAKSSQDAVQASKPVYQIKYGGLSIMHSDGVMSAFPQNRAPAGMPSPPGYPPSGLMPAPEAMQNTGPPVGGPRH